MNTRIVYDMNNLNSEWHYLNLSARDALINTYMVENKLTSQLHNSKQRDKISSMIKDRQASHYLLLNNYTIKKDV